MKRIVLILVIILFVSCSEKEDYDDIFLDITYTQWYLTRTNWGGGMVNLKIEGSTNGDKVTIRTYGDGKISDRNIELDSKKKFYDDVVISFTAMSVPGNEFESNTKVMAYRDMDTLTVTLNSGKLKY